MPSRRLTVDLNEVAFALDNASYEQMFFFDVQSGEIIPVSSEDLDKVEEIFGGLEEPDLATFDAALDKQSNLGWRRDVLLAAARVQADYGKRYARIEADDRHAGYRDMEAFIETVSDEWFRDRLEQSIRGRGAFRRFEEALDHRRSERERWFAFSNERSRERAREWLREMDIEAEDKPK